MEDAAVAPAKGNYVLQMVAPKRNAAPQAAFPQPPRAACPFFFGYNLRGAGGRDLAAVVARSKHVRFTAIAGDVASNSSCWKRKKK